MVKGVVAICEAYAGTLTEATAETYLGVLEPHMGDVDFSLAVREALEIEERWVSPAVILRVHRERQERVHANGVTSREEIAERVASDADWAERHVLAAAEKRLQ